MRRDYSYLQERIELDFNEILVAFLLTIVYRLVRKFELSAHYYEYDFDADLQYGRCLTEGREKVLNVLKYFTVRSFGVPA